MNIYIEGNIGVGKSTLINKIEEKFKDKFNYIQEPVEEWTSHKIDNSETKINFLSLYYLNPEKYSFLFQCVATLSLLKKKLENKINIIERSVYSSLFVFSKNLYDKKLITFEEYEFLKMWKDQYYKEEKKFIIIYIKDTSENCLKRIKQRNRKEEENISLEYLNQIENNYKQLLKLYNNNVFIIKHNHIDKMLKDLDKILLFFIN